MNSRPPILSLIVPCFNEERRIEKCISLVRESLDPLAIRYEVLVVDDGSWDRTAAIVHEAGHPFRLLGLEKNGGKGRAVRAGVLHARGEVIAFTDADVPVDLSALNEAIGLIRSNQFDMVVGDRTLVPFHAHVRVPLMRRIASVGFRWCKQVILPTCVRDTQCGLKAYRADVARFLFDHLDISNFTFDVEIIARAERAGMRIASLPTAMIRSEHSTVRLRRHVVPMLMSLYACRVNQKNWPRAYERPAIQKDRAA